jgi:hypothetical protein
MAASETETLGAVSQISFHLTMSTAQCRRRLLCG